jgi:hypothetical protein
MPFAGVLAGPTPRFDHRRAMPDRTASHAGATTSRRIHNSPVPADERCVKEDIFERDTAVQLAVLGGGAPFETRGRVLESSGGRVLVATPAPLQPGTPVRVEGNDTLVLGEICAVDQRENEWVAAVKIVHSLTSLAALERFNRALLGQEPTLIPSLRSSGK